MSTPLYFKSGAWNALCDVCGFKFKSTEMCKRWDGLMVCQADWEADHPQKYLRVREDKIATAWVRARPADLDASPTCYIWGQSAYADVATADCAQADNLTNFSFRDLYYMKNGSYP